ncbi:MAG: hypothetical protein U0R64_11405 [Candidatus Nanopelagicales bacterium]
MGTEPGREPTDTVDQLEWFHEATTMALYIGLSLLAVLVAQQGVTTESASTLWLTVFVTAIGLLLAHQVAFRLSTRLVNRGLLDAGALRLLGAQLAGGLVAAVIASLPVLLLGPSGILVSEALILAMVAITGYRVARQVPTSRFRALLYVGFIVVIVLGVLAVKGLAGH